MEMESKKNLNSLKIGRKTKSCPSSAPSITSSNSSLPDNYLQDFNQQPPSPGSSSSTSQTTGDTTFEPTIDMMVNDFDDEQTLTEEEALAEFEAQDPADEIETLQMESEMPLEILLSHYRQQVGQDFQHQQQKRNKRVKLKSFKKNKKCHASSKNGKLRSTTKLASSPSSKSTVNQDVASALVAKPMEEEVIVIEESEDEVEILKTEQNTDIDAGDGAEDEVEVDVDEENCNDHDSSSNKDNNKQYEEDKSSEPYKLLPHPEHTKLTALALLYPDKYSNITDKMDDDYSDEDDDDDDDYVKKTIMVGSTYQATIPIGLSKYGDILPYENEDKLIWEPSQVSEQDVENYLIRIKELSSSSSPSQEDDIVPSSSGTSTIKDDEQALHLLVQCGYNFKEALRRKCLNPVPLTGSMSLWSEEECRNFEVGIQKFGKDFRKIQQTQVRTRSIRELVQFYYLWKKTERRDQDFVDSDTIDHMDAYLDFDERDTALNGAGSNNAPNSCLGSTKPLPCLLSNNSYLQHQEPPSKRHNQHHNFSIMNETNRSSSSTSNHKDSSKKLSPSSSTSTSTFTTTSSSKNKTHRRRRNSSSSLLSETATVTCSLSSNNKK